jgi:hypothetical protein
MNHIENAMGLLDAAFAYLNILHPTEVEKKKNTGSCYNTYDLLAGRSRLKCVFEGPRNGEACM